MAKNNKKSFSNNLESLFEHTLYEDNLQDNPNMFFEEDKEEAVAVKEKTKRKTKKKKKRKSNRKSFSDGLESFFKESIEETIGKDAKVTDIKRGTSKKSKKRAIGIEVLLQRTLFQDEQQPQQGSKRTTTKRITLVFDREKVETLKSIARKEKKNMRQIVGKLIEEYIRQQDEE